MIVDVARSVAIVAASGYFIFRVTCHSVSLGLLSAGLLFICASESEPNVICYGNMVVLFSLGFLWTCYSAYLIGLDANCAAHQMSLVLSITCYGGITFLVSQLVDKSLLPSTRLKKRFASIRR